MLWEIYILPLLNTDLLPKDQSLTAKKRPSSKYTIASRLPARRGCRADDLGLVTGSCARPCRPTGCGLACYLLFAVRKLKKRKHGGAAPRPRPQPTAHSAPLPGGSWQNSRVLWVNLLLWLYVVHHTPSSDCRLPVVRRLLSCYVLLSVMSLSLAGYGVRGARGAGLRRFAFALRLLLLRPL